MLTAHVSHDFSDSAYQGYLERVLQAGTQARYRCGLNREQTPLLNHSGCRVYLAGVRSYRASLGWSGVGVFCAVYGFGVLIERVPAPLMVFFPDIDLLSRIRVIPICSGFADGVSPECQGGVVGGVVFLLAGKNRVSFTGHNTPIPIKEDNCPTRCYKNEEIHKSHCHCLFADPGLIVTSYSGPNIQPIAT